MIVGKINFTVVLRHYMLHEEEVVVWMIQSYAAFDGAVVADGVLKVRDYTN